MALLATSKIALHSEDSGEDSDEDHGFVRNSSTQRKSVTLHANQHVGLWVFDLVHFCYQSFTVCPIAIVGGCRGSLHQSSNTSCLEFKRKQFAIETSVSGA